MSALFQRKSPIVVTCAKGVPPFLRREISQLHLPITEESSTMVETEGTLEDALRLNLFLRTAHRVLFLLAEFKAENPQELYRGVQRLPWEEYISPDEFLSITADGDQATIRDFRFVSLKVKDAIVDRLREKTGRRPNSGPERIGVVIDAYWVGRRCRLYMDTSGEPLSRRGYRKISHEAPMQETLAAAVILATGWTGQGNFINPMCGSGTLAIEAALMARNRAPGIWRENFGFMHWKGFPRETWKKLHQEAIDREIPSSPSKIIATDIDPQAIRGAQRNARAAGVRGDIEFAVCDFAQTPIPPGDGVVVLNPEYGERMGNIPELESTYRRIGDFLKSKGVGYRGYIFTGNLKLAKKVGLRTRRRIPFFNGNIECRLLEYELYAGSRKSKPSQDSNIRGSSEEIC
jgi:23S rRNA G2445 N2-methylase RlmL